MNFSEALDLIKQGECLHRHGWNGENMFVFANEPELQRYEEGGKERIMTYGMYLSIHTGKVGEQVQPGWLPSQSDLFAEDWELRGSKTKKGDVVDRWDRV